MMQATVNSELFIGSYFFSVYVTDESCLELLSHWPITELDNVDLLNSVILQQDGVPAHYAANVRTFLNNPFPLWIGRHGPLIWPPRRPELTASDNWLSSSVKAQLSTIRMRPVADLYYEIRRIFNTVTPVILRRVSRRTWLPIGWLAEC
jgi:hypothetical protein